MTNTSPGAANDSFQRHQRIPSSAKLKYFHHKDQMVEQLYFQKLAGFFQFMGEIDVALAGSQVSRRMVVCDDDSTSPAHPGQTYI